MGDETLQPDRGEQGPPNTLQPGVSAAGRYRIERFIAAGGMGEVYAARDLVLDTTIALKTLRADRAGSADSIERLRREISLARNVTNPHVCRLHDVGDHDGRVFLTMELLEGNTLAQWIEREGALPQTEVERIALQLVDGMSALHRAGIIHRDFKSHNVIVVGDGDQRRAVITDFGLARELESDARLTVESSLLGTPAYMSPEQVEARPATKASDIYAFGVVLFEMLTGRLPFEGDTSMTTAMARLQQPAPRPSSVCDGVSKRWDAIVSACLARDPDDRPPRIEDALATEARSRRWFLAAGTSAIALGMVAAWRMGGCKAAVVKGPVAVLPVGGSGPYANDPWRIAITLDLYDELGTSNLELVSPYIADQFVAVDGKLAQLADDPDPLATLAIRGVTAVVQMTIARTPDRIELSMVGHGSIADWTHAVSRPISEVALLVSDAASAIASELGALPPRPPRDTAGLTAELYERWGQALSWNFRRRTDADRAAIKSGTQPPPRRLLRELARAAPTLARAHARLAELDMMEAEQVEKEKATTELAQIRAAVDAALAVDPDHPLALAVRGHLAMVAEWDWKAAERDTRRAIELAPNHSRVGHHHTFLSMALGRFDEILARVERRQLRDADGSEARKAWYYYYGRRWPDVVRVVEPTLPPTGRLDGGSGNNSGTFRLRQFNASLLAMAYAEMTRNADALALADRIRAEKPDFYLLTSLVPIYVTGGRIDDAKAIRAEIGTDTDLEALAIMDDALGDIDAALDKLEQVVAAHNIHALFLRIERFTALLRATPRFQKLMKTVFGDA